MPFLDRDTMELLEDLSDLIRWCISTEGWRDYGGACQSLFVIGDRLFVQAPVDTLVHVDSLIDTLRKPPRMPTSTEDTLRFDQKWAVRLPAHNLIDPPVDPTIDPSSDLDRRTWEELMDEVEEALSLLVGQDDWWDYGGEHHLMFRWRRELWVVSDQDIRQQVIDAAREIAEKEPSYWIEMLGDD